VLIEDMYLSEEEKQACLRARERIARKVADGRMVISYEEVSPEEWQALDRMLMGAGLDPAHGEEIDALVPSEPRAHDSGDYGVTALERIAQSRPVIPHADTIFGRHWAGLRHIGEKIDETLRRRSDTAWAVLTGAYLILVVLLSYQNRQLKDQVVEIDRERVAVQKMMDDLNSSRAGTDSDSIFKGGGPPTAALLLALGAPAIVTVTPNATGNLIQLLFYSSSDKAASDFLTGLQNLAPSELQSRQPTLLAGENDGGGLYVISVASFSSRSQAEQLASKLCEGIMASPLQQCCALRPLTKLTAARLAPTKGQTRPIRLRQISIRKPPGEPTVLNLRATSGLDS
jgi:hypothetical protein